MERQTDDQIAVDIVKSVKESFADLNSCSFDKGFHSKGNQKELGAVLFLRRLNRKQMSVVSLL